MADRFRYLGGVDFSGAKEPLGNLWSAVGREQQGKLHVLSLRPHAYRADLAAFVGRGWVDAVNAELADPVLWGVDFACGIPATAAEHLLGSAASWERALAWIADRPADEVRDGLPDAARAPRLTDGAGGVNPFDVRTYRQTVEGLRWLHELREEEEVAVAPQAALVAPCTIVEVSPAATAVDLGLPRRRAPSRPAEHRARAAALRTFLTFATPEMEAIAVTLEDAWDAVLCCLTACLVRDDLDQPFRLARHPRETLALEGWIYRPPAALT